MSGVSIVIATLNCESSLRQCLAYIQRQDYPQRQMEVLILDGGSTDQTLAVAQDFSKTLPIKTIPAGYKENQEARRYLGFNHAKYDLVCILDSDNFLTDKQWLRKMIEPLENYSQVVSSFTLHYKYDPTQTYFNRYVALFGNNDPVVYYLGKADRARWIDRQWPRPKQIVKPGPKFTLVRFSADDCPTLGSNGSIIRKSFLDLDKLSPVNFFHTDILYDLVLTGNNLHAVVNTSILHATSSSLGKHLAKRKQYMVLHHLQLLESRRYKIFDLGKGSDWVKLGYFVLLTVTIIGPLMEAAYGYFKIRDRVWWLHPLVCWAFLVIYFQATARYLVYGYTHS